MAFIEVGEEAAVTFDLTQLNTKDKLQQAMTQLIPTRGKTNVVQGFDVCIINYLIL